MNAKISVFVICVEVIMYLLIHEICNIVYYLKIGSTRGKSKDGVMVEPILCQISFE